VEAARVTDLVVVPPETPFAAFASVAILGEMAQAFFERGRCHLALTGGTTPRAVYAALVERKNEMVGTPRAKAYAPVFAKTTFYFGDERCVPADDPESNFKMAKDSLAGLGALDLKRREGERPDVEQAARDYEALLPPAFDVLLLGIGEDGHLCSLFPGFPQLDEKVRRVVVVDGSPKPPAKRMTITPPVIGAARSIIVMATGAGKADAVARALEGDLDPKKTPAQLARRGTWIVDEAAASNLKKETS
jgi:6-phosphogluconolactonase